MTSNAIEVKNICFLSLAYIDTRLGQIMVNCDAWLKSVWHGVFMSRERRTKFADRWRQISEPSMTRSISNEFETAGLQELKQDADYFDAKVSFQHEPRSDDQTAQDDQFLMTYADDLSMVLTVHLEQISQWKNCLMFNGNFTIQSQIKAVEERLDNQQFQRLKALLQVHERYLRSTFPLKGEVRKYIYLLELVCFLFTVLVALKRRMKKIPNMNRLLSVPVGKLSINRTKKMFRRRFFLFHQGDDIRTERELPPFIYSKKHSSDIFPIERETMFHLHGGIQFEYETSSLNDQLSQ